MRVSLYDSIQKVLSRCPRETRLYMCHDYAPGAVARSPGKPPSARNSTNNIHVGGGTSEADYVKMRTERDAQLSMPKLIIPSVQVNMRAGEMPEPDESGKRYLKVPVDGL